MTRHGDRFEMTPAAAASITIAGTKSSDLGRQRHDPLALRT